MHPKNAFEGVGASPFKKTVALEGAVRSSRIVFDYALSQDDTGHRLRFQLRHGD